MKDPKCPDCWGDNTIFNSFDQTVCRDCGLIYEELAPEDQELYNKEQMPN